MRVMFEVEFDESHLNWDVHGIKIIRLVEDNREYTDLTTQELAHLEKTLERYKRHRLFCLYNASQAEKAACSKKIDLINSEIGKVKAEINKRPESEG